MTTRQAKAAYLDFDGVALGFDCVDDETYVHEAEATEFQVEQGVNVSDHVRNKLDVIELDVFVSNTPVRDVNNLYNGQVAGLDLPVKVTERSVAPTPGALMNAGLDAIASAISGAPEPWKASVLQFPEKFNNCQHVIQTLLGWKERGVRGKVHYEHQTYESMVITKVEVKRTATTGDGVEIAIALKEMRIVETKLVTVPIPTEPRGKTMQKKGRQPTGFVRDAPAKKSFAKELQRFLRGE